MWWLSATSPHTVTPRAFILHLGIKTVADSHLRSSLSPKTNHPNGYSRSPSCPHIAGPRFKWPKAANARSHRIAFRFDRVWRIAAMLAGVMGIVGGGWLLLVDLFRHNRQPVHPRLFCRPPSRICNHGNVFHRSGLVVYYGRENVAAIWPFGSSDVQGSRRDSAWWATRFRLPKAIVATRLPGPIASRRFVDTTHSRRLRADHAPQFCRRP